MNAEGAKLSGKRTAKVKKSLEISLSWRETEGSNLSGKRTGGRDAPLFYWVEFQKCSGAIHRTK